MDLLIKAAAAAVAAAVLGLVLKGARPEFSLLLALAAGCFVIVLAAETLLDVVDFLYMLSDYTGLSGQVFGIVLKAIAIAAVTRLASDVCKDAGHAASSVSLELIGSVTVLYTALPLFETMLQMINTLL